MKMRKRFTGLLLAGLFLVSCMSLTACGNKPSKLATEMFGFGDSYYLGLESRYTVNYDEMVYDDWTGGSINKDLWVISDSVWDQWGTDQNGVRPQNLFLVEDEDNPDTHLAIRANGAYYDADANAELWANSSVDGINTAACISSVEAFGPGRYDIMMKPCPRMGALTSMWLFSWFNKDDGSVQQNEIDIEIGLNPQMDTVYFTTWTSPSTQTHENNQPGFFLSDGDWHLYSFDWVTEAEVPYVDFYIDGELMRTITTNVPTTNATLSIGVWCPSWSGGGIADSVYNVAPESRMFESDYAEFSWFRYIPFSMGNWEQRPVENRSYDPDYEPEVISKVPVVNKCANSDFERTAESYVYPAYRGTDAATNVNWDVPWKDYTVYDELDTEYYNADSVAEISADPLNGENHCAHIEKAGMLAQWLRGIGNGFKLRITGKFYTTGNASAAMRFVYTNDFTITGRGIGADLLTLGSSGGEWKEFTYDLTISYEGTKSLRYYLLESNYLADAQSAVDGAVYFDDIVINYLGHI